MSDAHTRDARDASSGSTPLDPDESAALLPSHITTQSALNEWEQANIAAAQDWAIPRRRRAPSIVLTPAFAVELHRRMFDMTWSWAGAYRLTDKNIGVPASQVRTALHERIADALVWYSQDVFEPDERAARFHYQLVLVHPWPNGNGRWARLMADALLYAERRPLFTWGRGDLVEPTGARDAYLGALRAADRGEFAALLAFVRS